MGAPADKLYEENGKVAAVFWEWRHKIFSGLVLVIISLGALEGWFLSSNLSKPVLIATPLFAGAIFCLLAFLFDRKNVMILRKCYQIGAELEGNPLIGPPLPPNGIYRELALMHSRWLSYTNILQITYLISMTIFVIAGLAVLISPESITHVTPVTKQDNVQQQ